MIRGSPSRGIKYGIEACDHWLGFFLCLLSYCHFYAIVGKKGVDRCSDAKRLEDKLRAEHVVDCGSTFFEGNLFAVIV
jgi:hypothetical protein